MRRTLARVARVLGVPARTLLASVSDPDAIEARDRSAVLDLVRIHLDRSEPDARRRSVEALQALLDGAAGNAPAPDRRL